MFPFLTCNVSAASLNKLERARDFVEDKGVITGTISGTFEIDNGVIFETNYLSSGETSYLKYEELNGDVVLTIIEDEHEDEFLFKSTGEIFLDGQRNTQLESYYQGTSANMIMPRATYVTTLYKNFNEVPGYSYWSTQTFQNPSDSNVKMINVAWDATVGGIAILIVAGLGVPTSEVQFFYDVADFAINVVEDAGVTSAVMELYESTRYMYNPMTLQYLYEEDTRYSILNRSYSDLFYKLETYN